jgi:hypothetical protein
VGIQRASSVPRRPSTIPESTDGLARRFTSYCDAWFDNVLSVLLAETLSGDVERAVIHVRLLALLFLVRSTVE